METRTNVTITLFKSGKLLIENLELFYFEGKILVVSAVYDVFRDTYKRFELCLVFKLIKKLILNDFHIFK